MAFKSETGSSVQDILAQQGYLGRTLEEGIYDPDSKKLRQLCYDFQIHAGLVDLVVTIENDTAFLHIPKGH